MKPNGLIALSVAVVVGALAVACERTPQPEAIASRQLGAAGGAVIVIAGVHSREGIGHFPAISISNRQTIQKLEAFFPDYRKRLSSEIVSGWRAGYRVYFRFAGGEVVCVTVSSYGGGASWSTGANDSITQGDFAAFVKELQRADTPPQEL